ncbi:MAG TPA: zinc-ribbon domain-containing protein [Roseomonas sp.]|nr:zinc-ribbon domain-containing protein [Roseomonas sp.]
MRIECPGCAAAYEVREELLPPGREVRCLRCGRTWAPVGREAAMASEPRQLPSPAAPSSETPPPRRPMPLRIRPRLGASTAEPEPPPPLPPPEEPPAALRSLAAPLLAWAASLLLVGGALAVLWAWRAEIVAFWPPAERLVQALGGG